MVPSFLVEKCKNFIRMEGIKLPSELSLSIDTRSIDNHNTFICLRGPRFDGHNFIKQAIEKDSRVVIVDNSFHINKSEIKNVSLVIVKNTLEFMQELAGLWSKLWQSDSRILIGLTGSSGKTTNKEMLVHILKGVLGNNVYCTKGNLNNHIGVPLTLFGLEKHHKVAIIEMGTNHPGEIELLCKISDPSAGLITNIGPAHLEFLKNLEGVFFEKTALFRWIKKNQKKGPLVFFNDDLFLSKLNGEYKTVGIGQTGDYSFKREKNCLSVYNAKNKYTIFNDSIYGDHNFINIAQTFLLAILLFPNDTKKLEKAASSFKIQDRNRGFWHNISGKKIFLDAYNSNPASMKASLQSFMEETQATPKHKILLIIGEMKELGKESEKFHKHLGQHIQAQKYPNVVFIGKYAKSFQEGLANKINTYSDIKEFKKDWPKFLMKYEIFFLKGSRALQLESCLGIKSENFVFPTP